ncbi:hypothetical protein NQ317_008321 [Molorchus minor]|uniref:DNA-directed DNA polymerase n=1 Tax=Molorchus minor TaxID=1323400 RepID=A0ABQ9JQG9_9CUCU|nr:hypothetical protein NQ317_008321 [Molorchus minor]
MPLILDVQGFKAEKNKFIVKELAAYNGHKTAHYIFKPPFSLKLLPPDLEKQVNWLTNNYHCIHWNEGNTPYYNVGKIIQNLIESDEKIYVKGKEKAEYIKEFSSKPIYELEEHPPLRFSEPQCFYHLKSPFCGSTMKCEHCKKVFFKQKNLLSNNLIDRKKINRSIVSSLGDGVAELRNAFKNRIASYRFSSSRDHIDFYDFMWEVKQKVLDIIDKCMKKYHTLKVNFEIFGLYEIPEKELSDIKSFNTKNKIITIATDLHQIFEEFTEEMTSQASEFQEKDSGWTLKHILFLDVNINKFTPMSASSYIKLPKAIAYKNAVLNIYNKDNACFAWSINASIFPAEGDPQQTTSYPHYDTLLNFRDLEFPMKLKDISKFEKMNNISRIPFKLASNKESVSVIAQTKEKYISFSKSILVEKSKTAKVPDTYLRLKFVDSFRFLSKSLDKLSQSLESEQCIETRRYFENEEEFGLIRQKGVFPYNYIDSFEKLEETQLPSRDKFYNDLTNESISSADYERATKVWNTFKCKTLGEYADIYLKSDIFLLADVFENFRRVCLTKYKLDPSHFLTSPSLSWDAMLRHTHIELELLTDVDAVHFFRKGIRGGVSQCSKRKAVANNKFLPNYDSSKPTSYIMYLDATNLYGAAMKEMLPTSDFKWLEKEEIEKFDCSVIDTNSPKGYVLEVDLEYPPHLHDDHNELPLCPEQMTPPKSKNPKLIPNLRNKYKYIIHYRNLKQCLKYGMKLKKIHRILEFSQSTWLGSYIDLNTKLRNSAKNEFEKDLFKLMVNSIFGKTMENVDKRQDIKLCSCWENKKGALGARALIAKPHFKSCSIFDENLVAVQLQKLKVVYDKPLYVGFSILDISKTIIYEFLYGYIKPMYGDDAIILYTDTDSLILEIFTDNVYDDIKRNINFFDTSNYDVNNIHNMPKTISVVGKMKDEYAGRPIECFYGTGAKAYCVKAGDLMKKAKGVSRSVIKHQIDFSDYVQIVENGGLIFRKMSIFKSDLHTIHTELKNKVALSSADDKRYVIPGDVYTLAWGHRLIPEDFSDNKLDTLLKYADMEESKAGWNRGDLDKFDWDNFDLDLLDL